jgi:hypothetical protein
MIAIAFTVVQFLLTGGLEAIAQFCTPRTAKTGQVQIQFLGARIYRYAGIHRKAYAEEQLTLSTGQCCANCAG